MFPVKTAAVLCLRNNHTTPKEAEAHNTTPKEAEEQQGGEQEAEVVLEEERGRLETSEC